MRGEAGRLWEAARATRSLLEASGDGLQGRAQRERGMVGRSGVAAGMSEQVETTEAGIFCAVLNITTQPLGRHLLSLTHWKPLSLAGKQRQCDQERGAKEARRVEGGGQQAPGDKAAGQVALPGKQPPTVQGPTENYFCWGWRWSLFIYKV